MGKTTFVRGRDKGSKAMIKWIMAFSAITCLSCAQGDPKESIKASKDDFQNYYDLTLSDTEFDWIKTISVVTDSLDKDNQPLNQIDEFKVDGKKRLWVYCKIMYLGPRRYWYSTELVDSQGKVIDQSGTIFTPTNSSWMFFFSFKLKKTIVKPGTYRFVIKLNNRTISEVPIKFIG